VKRLAEKAHAAPENDGGTGEPVDPASRRQSRYLTTRTMFEEDLDLSPEDVSWLAENACALRELRWYAVSHLHLDGVNGGDVWAMVKLQRDDILREVEAYLGPEAYLRFRAIGGIGLLNDNLECVEATLPAPLP